MPQRSSRGKKKTAKEEDSEEEEAYDNGVGDFDNSIDLTISEKKKRETNKELENRMIISKVTKVQIKEGVKSSEQKKAKDKVKITSSAHDTSEDEEDSVSEDASNKKSSKTKTRSFPKVAMAGSRKHQIRDRSRA